MVAEGWCKGILLRKTVRQEKKLKIFQVVTEKETAASLQKQKMEPGEENVKSKPHASLLRGRLKHRAGGTLVKVTDAVSKALPQHSWQENQGSSGRWHLHQPPPAFQLLKSQAGCSTGCAALSGVLLRPDRRMTEFQTQSWTCVSWKSFISAEGSDSGGSSPAHCSKSQSLAGRGLGLDLLHIPFPVNHTHFPRKSFGAGCAAATSAVLPVQSSPCRSPGIQAQPGHRTCLSEGCLGARGVQAKF